MGTTVAVSESLIEKTSEILTHAIVVPPAAHIGIPASTRKGMSIKPTVGASAIVTVPREAATVDFVVPGPN